MRRFYLVSFAIMTLFISGRAAQYRTVDGVTKQRLLDLISNHPDTQLRTDMLTWYQQGKFKILVDPKVPALGWHMVYEVGRPKVKWPGFLVSPDFFSSTFVTPDQQKKDPKTVVMEKFRAVYHEYVHLVNHFSGKFLLDQGGQLSVKKQAEYNWGTELDAFWGEWKFLKRTGYGSLMVKPGELAQYGEWGAFVRATYYHLMAYPQYTKFKPYWDELFKEELKRPRP